MKLNHALGRAARATIGGLLVCASAAALAGSQTWDLSGLTFDDGTQASGSFTYDAVTDTVSAWSITTAAGLMQGVAYGGFTYDPSNSSQYGTTVGTGGYWNAGNQELFLVGNDNFNFLELDFAKPLTNAGGTASLLLLSNTRTGPVSLESDDLGDARYVTAGDVNSVPEPSALSLAGLGLVGLFVARRRKQS